MASSTATALAFLIGIFAIGPTAFAQTLIQRGNVVQISVHVGEMSATLSADGELEPFENKLRFEPYQLLGELFRDDFVFVMRHGPTDWSKRDAVDVAPGDCERQRVMIEYGIQSMENLGVLLATNELLPGKIIVSEWCRNQQTLEAMQRGMEKVMGEAPGIPVETSADLNLLLSLQGAPTVGPLRDRISSWTGEGADGPLLIITHYTNIEEMLDFRVYEGEILIVDPKRNNRVLGYLRLDTASPDVGHFQAAE